MKGTLLDGVRLDRGGPVQDLLAADPARPFLRWRGGEWTVGEFADAAGRCAAELRARGIERGDRVAIMSRNSEWQLAWQYGVHFLGAVEVPVNADLRGPMLDHVLADSDPKLVLAQPELLADAAPLRAPEATEAAEPVDVRPDELATILYTSGTTGPSKGVMLPHGYFSNLGAVLGGVLGLEPDDVAYFVMPFFHVDAHIVAPACLQSGSVLSFIERFSVRRFWADVVDFDATWWFVIGSILEAVRSAGVPASTGRLNRAVGAPIPDTAYRFFEDELGIRIQSMYGQTEADAPCYETRERRKRGSAGVPCCGFDVAVVDDAGTELPAGGVGEIVYRPQHANLMTLGYWRRDTPLRDGWFHSGDLGTFDEDGFLFFRGRMTDSLRRRGENVSAYELEATLRGAPGVDDCAAVGVRDELGGEDEIKVFVTLEDGVELDAGAFFAFCEANLPRFAVPRFVEVVEAATLVRSPGTGVIQKHRLPAENGPRTMDRLAA